MKANTAIGIGGAFVILGIAVVLEGGNPASFINIPAFLIVVGGTAMAVLASTSMEMVKRVPTLYKKAMGGSTLHPDAAARQMIALAEKARREGLLALENDLEQIDDAYTRKGIQLVVDGADSDLVSAVLSSETNAMAARHQENAHVFALAGGFAPTLGILGTVMSLVHVLENLDQPSTLGSAIAGAFLATLFGVGSANLVFLPVANRLKELSREELLYRDMLQEAVLAIQAGDNPRILAEKLETFVPPEARGRTSEPETAATPTSEQLEAA
ncbi:MAG TPA: flagellar motor protein [Gaiellaceae bacterium]|jgi:chemotaxis protein MotA|nr:flagellar motor protein [Gaiellaceae bacterium]